jgi:hypothetical protein
MTRRGTRRGATTHFVVSWYKKLDSTARAGSQSGPTYLCLNAVGATFRGEGCKLENNAQAGQKVKLQNARWGSVKSTSEIAAVTLDAVSCTKSFPLMHQITGKRTLHDQLQGRRRSKSNCRLRGRNSGASDASHGRSSSGGANVTMPCRVLPLGSVKMLDPGRRLIQLRCCGLGICIRTFSRGSRLAYTCVNMAPSLFALAGR